MTRWNVMMGLYAALTTSAWAAPPGKFLLFPPGTTSAEADAITGNDNLAFFNTAPHCSTGVLPCRRKLHHNLALIWHGTPDADGTCAPPTIRVLKAGNFSVDATRCTILYVTRRLHMGHPFSPKPAVTDGSGLDFGDVAGGLDFIPRVPVGYQMTIRTWQRAGALRCSWDGCTHWIRVFAGGDYRETFRVGTPAPTDELMQDLNHASTNDQHGWDILAEYPYIYIPAYPWAIWLENIAGFTKFTQTNFLQARVAINPNLQRDGFCTYGGQLPTKSLFTCDARQRMIGQQVHL